MLARPIPRRRSHSITKTLRSSVKRALPIIAQFRRKFLRYIPTNKHERRNSAIKTGTIPVSTLDELAGILLLCEYGAYRSHI